MRTFAALMVGALMGTAGCSAASQESTTGDDEDVIAADPLAMPKPMLTFLKTQSWGSHHLEWHTSRQWDLLGANDQAWAKKQGWARANLQEGQKGNGLEFLAMHRVMIRTLSEKFPADAHLFNGWSAVPTSAKDPSDPIPASSTPIFDLQKAKAIDTLENHLDTFASDDDLGLFLETSLRPTSHDPSARATDKAAGIHNYVHNRYADAKSKIDIGDPSVNLQNKRFWRLHGWIESRWTEYRAMKKMSDTDPAYEAAIQKAEMMLKPGLKGVGGGAPEPPPESLRKFFEQDGS